MYDFYRSDDIEKVYQRRLKSLGKGNPDCRSKNDGQKCELYVCLAKMLFVTSSYLCIVYTAENVREILEREVGKQQEKLSLLRSSESSLKYTVTILSKREIINSLNNLSSDFFYFRIRRF